MILKASSGYLGENINAKTGRRSSERFILFTRVQGNPVQGPEFVHCSSNENEDSSTSTYNAEDSPKSSDWVSCTLCAIRISNIIK